MPTTNLTVTLGVRHLEQPKEVIAFVDGELDPDMVFVACNRIDTCGRDKMDLPFAWQRELRELIDVHGAPSMSVGDIVSLTMNGGRTKAIWVCATSGWDHGVVECVTTAVD